MKQQKGFTLIELIIVIIILGILAVTAAPRFFNFASDARESTVKGLEGAAKAASEMVYAKALIGNVESAPTSTIDGVDIVFGYPAATATGILEALDLSTGDWTGLPVDDALATASGTTLVEDDFIIHPEGRAPVAAEFADTACFVYYKPATASAGPTIGSVVTGC